MNLRILPFALFTALVAVAAPATAGEAAVSGLAPVRVEVVDARTLEGIRGKFLGADMLVGLKIELASKWHTPEGTLQAGGTLQVLQHGGGYAVQVDSHSSAGPDDASGSASSAASATGADTVSANGIGQVTQIAGDGNRHSNVTTISFAPASQAGGSYNGQASSSASYAGMVATVSFDPGAINLGLANAGGHVGQSIATAGGGGLMQTARIAGNGQASSNLLQLQVLTERMPQQQLRNLGIEQALSGMAPLGR